MTPKELWNRGNNLLAVSILGLSGFAFLPEMFLETEVPFKIDEGLLFLLGLAAIGWCLKGKHKFQHSIVPVIMVWAGLAIKIMGLVIEFKDKEDAGDDFGAVILFLLAGLFVTFLYLKAKKVLVKN